MTIPSVAARAGDPPSDSRPLVGQANWEQTLSEVERIRALVINLHRLLQGTPAVHLVSTPIENIHRSLDRLQAGTQPPPQPPATLHIPPPPSH